MDKKRIREIAPRFAGLRLLVVGDLMLDEFIWGKVSRISPEAPVPVVDVTSESYYPGGAANVARNLREFTSHVAVLGAAGDDAAGSRLVSLLAGSGMDTAGVMRHEGYSTIVKTRVIARHQQVVRVDRDCRIPSGGPWVERAIEFVERAAGDVDGIVVSDYNKGFVTQALADRVLAAAQRHGKVLTVDPHPRTALEWKGATAIKPNRSEAFHAAGLPPSDPVEPAERDLALLEAGHRLLQRWQPQNLVVTLGEQGMMLFRAGEPCYHVPASAQDVFDVSGAGDTAIALFTLGLCAGADAREAAELANLASGIVVGKLGTATVNPVELEAALG
ncbi:MAG: PfkB family carbohydrate kinase [Bryobacteraceae bacterium]|jgi:D-beta-D-heptose 7-phosphate kinase/D-beta-D-heptose 1-phosphate adenosyltransferase